MDKMHETLEKRKLEDERKKTEEQKKQEQQVFEATKRAFGQFEKMRALQLKQEEEAKQNKHTLMVANALKKHSNLRKSLAEAEKKKADEERKKQEEIEKKRQKQLEKQKLKMKKFEENNRWKKLPKYIQEREQEYIDTVKKLKAIEPSRSKYEFFDVARPEAWDVDLLNSEYKKAVENKGTTGLEELQALNPRRTKTEFYDETKDDPWDFEGLDSAIAEEQKLLEDELSRGQEQLNEIARYDREDEHSSEEFYRPDDRPRWDFEKLDEVLKNLKEAFEQQGQEGAKLLEQLLVLSPSCKKEDYVEEKSDLTWWNCSKLSVELEKEKARWKSENEAGEVAFAQLLKVAPDSRKEDFFRGDESSIPWDLNLIEETRDGRIQIKVQIGADQDNELEFLHVFKSSESILDLRKAIAVKADKELERVTLVFKGTKMDDKESQSLQEAGIEQDSKIIAIVSQKEPTPEPTPSPEPVPEPEPVPVKKPSPEPVAPKSEPAKAEPVKQPTTAPEVAHVDDEMEIPEEVSKPASGCCIVS